MTTSIIRVHVCDACQQAHGEGPPERWTRWVDGHPDADDGKGDLVIDLGAGTRELDICLPCRNAITWPEVLELYVTQGRPVKTSPRMAGTQSASAVRTPMALVAPSMQRKSDPRRQSQICPWCRQQFADYRRARTHVVIEHGYDPNDFPLKCPLCADLKLNPQNPKMFGVRRHISGIHGLTMLNAYLEARDTGDPMGLWRAVNEGIKESARIKKGAETSP